MMKFHSIAEILDFAIQKEEEAYQLYSDLAGKMKRESMRLVFLQFAGEEKLHKAKLLDIQGGKFEIPPATKVTDLKIGDNLEEVNISEDLSYQQALILAMKAEKNAYKLYSDLAELTTDPTQKGIFLQLAQEEARHKLRFEIEYDDFILQEN
jgi:rubrerythrin